MDSNKLSQRLLHVAQHVPVGARLADIGSDHAYLPVYLAKKGLISFAVAGEVVAGPHHNATKIIAQEQMSEIVQSRLADGLAAYTAEDQIDTVTICGMGGPLMVNILSADPQKLAAKPLLILQPNVGADAVREWLMNNYYEITAEEILSETGHVYELMVAQPVANIKQLSADEIFFGPKLVAQKDPAFIEKWTRELHREEKICTALTAAGKTATPKYQEVTAKIVQIKGVLADDDSQ
ncbi:SAM-dependent methyltransferase [Ligilactobacillus pabuli]|uniref:SAM-dependent methyltransferase n=1 Tax=Ligilactobacillus pabuli TaxID=2886039 RepID=A0ABQ5JEP1_9LACO|nr:tRNA (adenine(22)-N(1))-methyltransferase TrmK [Ligilactobacillus pabuli]GKS80465.1 SAM-dependent methyltransferase [Ligilactobacillus pabuli]